MIKNRLTIYLLFLFIPVIVLSGLAQRPQPRPDPSARPQNYENDVILPPELRTRKTIGDTLPLSINCLSQYMPASNAPLKTICINLNIFQKSDGSGNWQNTVTDIANLNQIVAWANGFYYNCPPTDPCPGVSSPIDTQIRFNLRNIYFYQNDTLWGSSNSSQLLNAVFTAHPDAKKQLNIMLTEGSYGGASAYALLPSTTLNYDQCIVQFHTYSSGPVSYYAASGTLAHELGHTLDLLHPSVGGCCSESCNTNSCEYLSDLFCPPTNPCPQAGYWGCDPNLPNNTCTNNMMGGTQIACYFSPLQIAKMHRALTIKSAQSYLFPCGGCGDCFPRPANIRLWLPFDEPAGSSVNDFSVYGNTGILYGNPNHLIPGKVSNALCLDGIDDYVEVMNKPEINVGSGDFSIDFWIKFDLANNAGTKVILDKRQNVPIIGYHIAAINGSLWLQLANGTGSGWSNYPSNINVADGQWHFIAVTVERNNVTGIKWYQDGSPVLPVSSASINPTGRTGTLDNNTPLLIGRQSFSNIGYVKGCIDELELLNRVLTQNEILSIFQAGPSGKCK